MMAQESVVEILPEDNPLKPPLESDRKNNTPHFRLPTFIFDRKKLRLKIRTQGNKRPKSLVFVDHLQKCQFLQKKKDTKYP